MRDFAAEAYVEVGLCRRAEVCLDRLASARGIGAGGGSIEVGMGAGGPETGLLDAGRVERPIATECRRWCARRRALCRWCARRWCARRRAL